MTMMTNEEVNIRRSELQKCLKWVEEMPVHGKAHLISINKVAQKIRKRIAKIESDDEIVEILVANEK